MSVDLFFGAKNPFHHVPPCPALYNCYSKVARQIKLPFRCRSTNVSHLEYECHKSVLGDKIVSSPWDYELVKNIRRIFKLCSGYPKCFQDHNLNSNIIAHGQNLPVQILIRGKRVRSASSGSVVYMLSQIQKI